MSSNSVLQLADWYGTLVYAARLLATTLMRLLVTGSKSVGSMHCQLWRRKIDIKRLCQCLGYSTVEKQLSTWIVFCLAELWQNFFWP